MIMPRPQMAEGCALEEELKLELSILDYIHKHLRCVLGDFLMPLISALGNGGFIWLCAIGVFLCTTRYRMAGLSMALALSMGLIVGNLILKPVFRRARPFAKRPELELIIRAPRDASFPSGHTLTSFAAATALFLAERHLGSIALVLAALIAFSRMYLYVHYPSDVLAGVLLGSGFGYMSFKMLDMWKFLF